MAKALVCIQSVPTPTISTMRSEAELGGRPQNFTRGVVGVAEYGINNSTTKWLFKYSLIYLPGAVDFFTDQV